MNIEEVIKLSPHKAINILQHIPNITSYIPEEYLEDWAVNIAANEFTKEQIRNRDTILIEGIFQIYCDLHQVSFYKFRTGLNSKSDRKKEYSSEVLQKLVRNGFRFLDVIRHKFKISSNDFDFKSL